MRHGGDHMKPVSVGEDLRISAPTWNRILSATEYIERLRSGGRAAQQQNAPVSGMVYAYNAAGENAPWHGLCELTGSETEQVNFVKPGAESGVGCYGVLLEPIGNGDHGLIALAGGPWSVLCSESPSVGDRLGPVDGFWEVRVDDAGPLIAACGSVGGVVVAFFSPSGVSLLGAYYPPNARTIYVVGSPSHSIEQKEQYIGGAWTITAQGFRVWKFDEPLVIPPKSCVTVQWQTDTITPPFFNGGYYFYGHLPNQTYILTAELAHTVIREDFDLASLTWSQFLALTTDVEKRKVEFVGTTRDSFEQATRIHQHKWGIEKYYTSEVSVYGFGVHVDSIWFSRAAANSAEYKIAYVSKSGFYDFTPVCMIHSRKISH